jgi:phosphohistidine phosphatase
MTVRELYVLRHGKSDWGTEGLRDHDRPLKPRGIEAARTMGRLLRDTGSAPDRVLSSSAVRARHTAELLFETGGFGCGVDVDERLYDASLETWLEVVRDTSDRVSRLVVAGHQPTCSEVIEHLTGAAVDFPTAALARLEVRAPSWDRLGPRGSRLSWLVTPRLLRALWRQPGEAD